MDELIRQALTIVRGVWHRRWIGLGVAWLVAVVGAVVLIKIPDRFEASARIYVDTQSVLKPLLAGLAFQPDIEQQVTMLARTLITRPNMEKLMRSSDIDLLASTPREKDRLVDELTKDIRLSSGGGRENIYTVAYRDVNPERAKKVVQNLVSMFVESGIGGNKRESETARKFIDDQIATYEKKLQDAENRQKEFRLKNMAFLGNGGQDYFARMNELTAELNRVRLELRVTEESRDALKMQLTEEVPLLVPEVPLLGRASSTTELDRRIEAQQSQLDEMLRRFTEQHPDVIAARRLIAQLEAERKREIEAQKKAEASRTAKGPATNPVFQQIKVALSAAEANVAALRARAGELSSRIGALRASAERVPQIEAEMAQLNRDYDVMRRNYEQLVQRRESASISEDVGSLQGLAEFRLIDPPRVSPKPVFPDRMALVPLILGLSIGAGVFAAFAVAQIIPTVHDTRVLREIGNRPVLGAVSMLITAPMLRRQRLMHAAFGSSLAALLLTYGAWTGWIVLTLRG